MAMCFISTKILNNFAKSFDLKYHFRWAFFSSIIDEIREWTITGNERAIIVI